MRVVLTSDTHGEHDRLDVPDGDILLHGGDISKQGTLDEIESFNRWLGTLPHRHKVLVAGNHDFGFQNMPAKAEALLTNCHYLLDEQIEIEGLKIYGSPWTPFFYDWAFQKPRGKALRAIWEKIPAGLDFLITHGPPAGILDRTVRGDHAGCEDLAAIVVGRQPRYHLFGHIHEAAGRQTIGTTTYLNASTVDLHYNPINPPFILEL